MRLASGSHVACAAAFRSASCEMSTSGHKPSGQDSTEPPPGPTEPALATGTLFSGISQYGRPQGRQMSSAVVSTSRATAFLGFGDNLELEKWRLGTRDFRVVGWEGSPGGRSWLNWPQRRCPSRVLGASCKGQRAAAWSRGEAGGWAPNCAPSGYGDGAMLPRALLSGHCRTNMDDL